MGPISDLLWMLAICGAATTSQIASLWDKPNRQTLLRLRRLERRPAELIAAAATLSPLRSGRPQLVWTLARNGALQANGGFHGPRLTTRYFPKGVLLAHVFLEDSSRPFVQRVSDRKLVFEEHGFDWPFPKGSGAIVCSSPRPLAVLPLTDEDQAAEALGERDGAFRWSERISFRIAAPDSLLPAIERLVSADVDTTDPFVTKHRSASEWLSIAARKDARPYRALILRTLKEKPHDEPFSLVPAMRSREPRFTAQVTGYDVGRARELPQSAEDVPKTCGDTSENVGKCS